jgi:hypothetical protein
MPGAAVEGPGPPGGRRVLRSITIWEYGRDDQRRLRIVTTDLRLDEGDGFLAGGCIHGHQLA